MMEKGQSRMEQEWGTDGGGEEEGWKRDGWVMEEVRGRQEERWAKDRGGMVEGWRRDGRRMEEGWQEDGGGLEGRMCLRRDSKEWKRICEGQGRDG
jgi:hypothetical protein